jgi:hypothetical protein
VRKYLGFGHDGLEFLLHRHFAYLAEDEKSWDAMLCCDDAVDLRDDYWRSDKNSRAKRDEAWHTWEAIPEKDRAWLEVVGIVPFEDILDIDEIGDDYFSDPHVYAPFNAKNALFRHFYARVRSVSTFDHRGVWPSDEQEDRVVKFPSRVVAAKERGRRVELARSY